MIGDRCDSICGSGFPITHHLSLITHLRIMKLKEVPQSPVFPADKKWEFEKRKDAYESDVTAFVRRLVEDEAIRDDQRWAWERWRNDESKLRK